MAKITVKKRNPSELTTRNAKYYNKKIARLEAKAKGQAQEIKNLNRRVAALEKGPWF